MNRLRRRFLFFLVTLTLLNACTNNHENGEIHLFYNEGLGDGINWGIAKDFTNDVKISDNEHVIAAENFENGKVSIVTESDCYRSNTTIKNIGAYTGNYCGEHKWVAGQYGPSCKFLLPNNAHKGSNPTYFVRMYFKFDDSFHPGGDASAGVGVKGFGIYNEEKISNVNDPCDGTNWYGVACQFVGWGPSGKIQANNKYLWVGHIYSYNAYPEKANSALGELTVSKPQTGDKPYRFSSYAEPVLYLQFGRWYCFEVGLYMNSPGKYDGEARFWIDGVLQSRVTNMRLRNVKEHLPHYVTLNLHRTTVNFEHTMIRCTDNIVVANRYIGPVNKQ